MLKYAKVLQLSKRADYIDQVNRDILDKIQRVPANQQPSLSSRLKALFSSAERKRLLAQSIDRQRVQAIILKNYFDRILASQHGIGQYGHGKNQKSPVKQLFIHIDTPKDYLLPYNKWKNKIKIAVQKGKAAQLEDLINPIQFYAKTSNNSLQIPQWYKGYGDLLKFVYNKKLPRQTLQKLRKNSYEKLG